MKPQLEAMKAAAFSWVLAELEAAPFCQVAPETEARGKLCYRWNEIKDRLPQTSGIYVVYPINSEVPLYAGEAGKLRQRVEYHFAESPTARERGTLKRKLAANGYAAHAATYTLVRFKHIEVPFGRKEIEVMIHEKYGINTKAPRKRVSPAGQRQSAA